MVKRKANILNILSVVAIMFVAIWIMSTSANAGTKNWTLRYSKGSPSNTQITSTTVSDTMSSTKVISVTVDSYSASENAYIHLSTSEGGLSVFFNRCKSADSTDEVERGTYVTGTAAITNPSSINSCFCSGYFTF